ncbi:MAG: hypothetical protein R3C05_08710 [Pirellulaceae bacterium]
MKTDGTVEGTAFIKDIFPGSRSSQLGSLIDVSWTLFFVAQDDNAYALWKSDGSESETSLVKDIQPDNISATALNT